MIQGSPIFPAFVDKVEQYVQDKRTALVVFDSNHTHEHVLTELEKYPPIVTVDSYLIVFDTLIEDMPDDLLPQDRP